MGDRVLATITSYLAESQDHAFRVGGDEFVVLMESKRKLTRERLQRSGETLRRRLGSEVRRQVGIRVTASGGGIGHPGKAFGSDERLAPLFFSTVERLVLEAKREGRDRLLVLPESPEGSERLIAVMAGFYQELARINYSVARELESESRIDSLTGLYNRRSFDAAIAATFKKHQRTGKAFAVLCIDSDSLKDINDTEGHDAGDRFLLDVSGILKATVRGSDHCSRWGGDEFAVVAENIPLSSVRKLGERIRRTVDTRTLGTVSIGVFCGKPASAEEAMKKADLALYEAKDAGKNAVVAVT